MRSLQTLLAVLTAGLLLAACEDSYTIETSDDGDGVRIEVRANDRSDKREALEDQLREAKDRIREELSDLDEDDIVTREELERLRDQIETSAERLQDEFDDADVDVKVDRAMEDLGDALEKIGQAIKEDKGIEPIDHRKLRDLLPREVAGMERYDTDGSTTSALGIRVSKVEGKYDGGPGDMSISIVDLGSLSGAATAGLEMLNSRIDREMENGYERTTEIDGYPAFISIKDRDSRVKRVAIIHVTDRFLVAIDAEGRNLPDNIIDQAVDRISLRRLARLGRR